MRLEGGQSLFFTYFRGTVPFPLARQAVMIVAFDRQSWNYQPAGELTLMPHSAINAQPY